MKVEITPIEGLLLIRPRVFEDDRGFFFESFNAVRFRENRLPVDWVQDNHSRSVRNTVRGLHFQRGKGQAKLVRCVRGSIWDVAVDIRPKSPTFGRWFATELSDENKAMLYVPEGFAHGYAVLSETADALYKCNQVYDPTLEDQIQWNDPEIGVEWPVSEPILSARDRNSQSFRQYRALMGVG